MNGLVKGGLALGGLVLGLGALRRALNPDTPLRSLGEATLRTSSRRRSSSSEGGSEGTRRRRTCASWSGRPR